jgi:Transposase and inactivated derivatives, IS30 family
MTSNYTRYSNQAGLTDSDIMDIRDLSERANLSAVEIADRYGVARSTVDRILARRTWQDVPSPKTVGTNYVVYADGRVFSKNAGRFIATTIDRSTGQEVVELRTKGIRGKVSTAELVAKLFLGTKSKRISFINGDPTDSHFTNLKVGK